MNRRHFAYWLSSGLFALSERIHAQSLDSLAAAVIQCTENKVGEATIVDEERWRAAENRTWRWFERDTLQADGEWKLSGRTVPIHKQTGEPYTSEEGYLDESLVPDAVRHSKPFAKKGLLEIECVDTEPGSVSSARKARDGRPPSKWLRSLHADEIACWLQTITVPEVGVSGMTVLVHLTRDHGFDEEKVKDLIEEDMFKLHAAAHYGY
jgi:hypothetical protein